MGSCFSAEMHQRALQLEIPSYSNPFGTIFSPTALAETIEYIYKSEVPPFFEYQQNFHCLLFANRFQNTSKSALTEQIRNQLIESKSHLINATHIFITLGTATIYEHTSYNQWVGNCQKLPQNQFTKRQLTIAEIKTSLEKIKNTVPKINPKAKLIFTVSPVRHLRDGLLTNSVSKALLRAALYEICVESNGQIEYFPSYEIVTEELKDLKFYKPDQAHPTDEAINVVFERFKETYCFSGTSRSSN
jgi:hypothetical protein